MKFKKLLVLIAALALLGTVAIFKKMTVEKTEAKKSVAAQPAESLGAVFAQGSVSKIRMSREKPEREELILEKNASGDWSITSPHGTKARKDAVERLLKSLSDIKGEVRSKEIAVLPDYQIRDDQAFHLEVFGSDGKSLAHILLSPQRPRGTQNFVRLAGSSQVLDTDTDILSELSIFSKEDRLQYTTFADLKPAGVDSSKVQTKSAKG